MKEKKKLFGRGIYEKSDIPIKVLNGFIVAVIVLIIALVTVFAVNGGYMIDFDTSGGSVVESQKLRHSEYVAKPETPVKPGYKFVAWETDTDPSLSRRWDFSADTVQEAQTLYAVWEPARLTVKFDLNGGSSKNCSDKEVVYGEAYGSLPAPEKAGFSFDGWVYSGEIITEETVVTMTGEHILTARWI